MGISCIEKIILKSQNEFHSIDKLVTGFSFDTHNEMGRFYDEKIYHEVIMNKCIENGIDAKKEVKIQLSFKDFTKEYKLDLLVDNGIIYEFKTVQILNSIHKQQLINYLLLTEIMHGKLINFRSESIEHEFVSTNITKEKRYEFNIDSSHWFENTNKCKYVKDLIYSLIREWGVFLDYNLYKDAIIFFLGGTNKVIIPVDIFHQNKKVGIQKMVILENKTILHFSGIRKAFKGYEKNIKRLINHSDIDTVQWINFNHENIIMKTIK